MAKAVFTTKVDPAYDDLPEERYHFPRRYLGRVRQTVGDWIVYYEPRRSTSAESSRGGRQSYFAIARVVEIVEDRNRADHFYAYVDNYLDLIAPVPFRLGGEIIESGLKNSMGELNSGAFQWAIRTMPETEYDLILRAGFVATLKQEAEAAATEQPTGFEEALHQLQRPVVESVVRRPFRDRAFTSQICTIYDRRCAMTGLRLINGGGRAEVQAAHIVPVASQGPDSVRNGLALSSTVHWMFDRGLVSVDKDYSIITSKGAIPEEIDYLLNRNDRKLRLPDSPAHRPARQYLEFHRNQIFKG